MACCVNCDHDLAALALRGDPAARKLLAAPALEDTQTIGKLLPTVVWPSDVEKYKRRLDPTFAAMNAAIAACEKVTPIEREGWRLFFSSWVAFSAQPVGIFGGSNEWDACETFERALLGWQTQVEGRCVLPVPKVRGPDDSTPDFTWVKWAAAAVIAGAVVYGVHTAAKVL